MRGGGQETPVPDMIHVWTFYDANSNTLTAEVDGNYATPVLRPLPVGMEFDPNATWAVLTGKAYNYQYGWLPLALFSLPAGAGLWIEPNTQSAGLEAYYRKKDLEAYTPIFGTASSPSAWQWVGGYMAHNCYAVVDPPALTTYSANYHVYFAHPVTGLVSGMDANGVAYDFSGCDDTYVTLTWNTVPEPSTMLLLALAGCPAILGRRRKNVPG
jgi:hypothetical protein